MINRLQIRGISPHSRNPMETYLFLILFYLIIKLFLKLINQFLCTRVLSIMSHSVYKVGSLLQPECKSFHIDLSTRTAFGSCTGSLPHWPAAGQHLRVCGLLFQFQERRGLLNMTVSLLKGMRCFIPETKACWRELRACLRESGACWRESRLAKSKIMSIWNGGCRLDFCSSIQAARIQIASSRVEVTDLERH